MLEQDEKLDLFFITKIFKYLLGCVVLWCCVVVRRTQRNTTQHIENRCVVSSLQVTVKHLKKKVKTLCDFYLHVTFVMGPPPPLVCLLNGSKNLLQIQGIKWIPIIASITVLFPKKRQMWGFQLGVDIHGNHPPSPSFVKYITFFFPTSYCQIFKKKVRTLCGCYLEFDFCHVNPSPHPAAGRGVFDCYFSAFYWGLQNCANNSCGYICFYLSFSAYNNMKAI